MVNARIPQEIPIVRNTVADLHELFDLLARLDGSTMTVLWRDRFPDVEAALRSWCEARGRRLDESEDEAGHSLSVRRANHSLIVTVRVDDPDARSEGRE